MRIGRVVIRDGSIDRHDASRLAPLVAEALDRGEAGAVLAKPGVRRVATQIAGEVGGRVAGADRFGGGAP